MRLFLPIVWIIPLIKRNFSNKPIVQREEKSDGNRKNGNAYLSWAMTELANLMVFYNPVIKKKYDRQLEKSHLRAKAIRSIAAKLARCIWHMLKKDKDFQIDLAFK